MPPAQMPNNKVVVVDDDPAVRAVLTDLLSQHRFEVLEATNGLEALVHVKRHRPVAIVLDLAMPRLGGLETLKRIRAFDPAATVVVITGTSDSAAHQQALAMGASIVLQKPFELEALLRALPTGASNARARGSILIVDDEADFRATLEEFLVAQGYDTRSAPEAGLALREIVRDRPDVVLLDLRMPGLSGMEAIAAIHAVAPGVKVIVVSGNPDAAVGKLALARGAFEYIVKPVDLAHLGLAIDTAIGAKRQDS